MRVLWRIEMWCRRQAAAAILPLLLVGWLTGESSEALTTFGKTNTQAPKDAAPTAPPARPCSRQGECAGISSSSCVRTHYDSVTRCLCGDNLPPLNGQCEAQTKGELNFEPVLVARVGCNSFVLTCTLPSFNWQASKALYHVCANSDECNDGLVCGTPNITGTAPPHLRVHAPQEKICLCDVETGFKEKEHTCSDADILKTSIFAIAVVYLVRKMVTY